MAEFKRINVATAHQLWQQENTKIVDIRDERSFAAGHIPGSQRLTDANLQAFLDSLDDHHVVVVCYHGNSSQGAASYLANQGLDNVSSLDGGMTAWAQQFPEAVERG